MKWKTVGIVYLVVAAMQWGNLTAYYSDESPGSLVAIVVVSAAFTTAVLVGLFIAGRWVVTQITTARATRRARRGPEPFGPNHL